MSDTPQTWLRWLGLGAVTLAAFWIAVVIYCIHAALPFNSLELPFEETVTTRSWAPQGWKFFTRNPREDQLLLFSRSGDRWQSASLGPNMRWSNLLGAKRTPRAQSIEMALLLHKMPASNWTPCDRSPTQCLEVATKTVHLRNQSPLPTLCGAIGMALQPPVPWAWAKSASSIVMPSKILKLEVQC